MIIKSNHTKNSVDLFVLPITASETIDTLQSYQHLLNTEERGRHQRLNQSAVRLRFLAARVLLRLQLGRTLNCNPATLNFVTSRGGKPRLSCNSPVQFNLSHSGDMIALVITHGVEPGVDIECIHRRNRTSSIAMRFFSPSELDMLNVAENSTQTFFTYWTLKEAYLKAKGSGLGQSLTSAVFNVHRRIEFLSVDGGTTPSFFTWRLDNNYQLSLCLLAMDIAPPVIHSIDHELRANLFNPVWSLSTLP